jgi:hypothetical protein
LTDEGGDVANETMSHPSALRQRREKVAAEESGRAGHEY